MRNSITGVFPTPIFESTDPDFECKQDLIDWIYKYKETTQSVVLSNRGGWQSDDMFYKTDRSFRPFIDYISNRIDAMIRDSMDKPLTLNNLWVNVNPPGAYNIMHRHCGCQYSGVLWVRCPEKSGNFAIINPKEYQEYDVLDVLAPEVKTPLNMGLSWEYTPEDGNIILFASHLPHLVETNHSEEDRISIAFNFFTPR